MYNFWSLTTLFVYIILATVFLAGTATNHKTLKEVAERDSIINFFPIVVLVTWAVGISEAVQLDFDTIVLVMALVAVLDGSVITVYFLGAAAKLGIANLRTKLAS